MSDLLNKASLVVIPSGYKEDTVYSVVPSDGSGDLSFTRASNGTRINSAGLVEVCPWNMVSYSEQFDNAYWTKVDCTVTADSTTAPNGTSTADSLLDNTSNFIHALTPALSKATTEITYTHSVYAKFKDTDRKIQLSLDDAVSGGVDSGVFNLSTGVWDTALGTPSAAFTNPSRNFENIGNGWYRISLTVTSNAGSQIRPNIFVINGSNASLYIGNGTGIYIWGAQLNIGSTAKPYFPTTDRLNVPRLTYQNGGGGCPSLLLEKQSTNLLTYSEQFDNAGWTKYNATITANTTTSPDGTQNADKCLDNTNNDYHSFYQSISISADTTLSIYVKAAEYSKFAISNASDGGDVLFNLSTVAVISTSANFKNAKIESVGNGWYRVSATTNGTSGGKAMGYSLVNDAGAISFLGTGSKGVFIWGAQIEQSSYPTSYIPTTSSSATRVEDVCNKTGVSSLIGQTEGVMFSDFNYKGNAKGSIQIYPFYIGQGTASNSVTIGLFEDALLCRVFVGGTPQNYFTSSTLSVGRHKVAFVYANNNLKLFLDGVLIQTDTSATIPTCDQIYIGASGTTVTTQLIEVNTNALWKTILTDAECIALTTI